MINKYLQIIIIVAGCALQSCEDGITLTLPAEAPSIEITIPAISTTGDFTVGEIPIETNIDSIASANDIDKSSITSVKVKSVTYTMVSPVDANFNFFKSIGNFTSTDTLPEVRYAHIDNIPNDGLNVLKLAADDVELKNYFLNNNMSLTLRGTNDAAVASDIKVRLDMTLEVKAQVIK